MSDDTKIEWCDSTFNPWIGCTKVGPGCDHCYAEADFDLRKHRVKWGAGNPRSRTSAENWKKPLQWDRQHAEFFAQHGRRRRVFCASLADVFDNEVPPEWRRDLFSLIAATPNLDWLLLTKRIGNAHQMIGEALIKIAAANGQEPTSLLPGWPWPHVWLGATICNQPEADRDISKLLAVPAAVRWLSIEPLLGPVNLFFEDRSDGMIVERTHDVDWVVVGGESGANARPMHPDWARALRDQCAAAGVPFLFKQWGEFAPNWNNDDAGNKIAGSEWIDRMGKKLAGRMLDGVQHDGYPESRP